MTLTTLTTDVANISKLDNYPPDDSGMTPALLKAKFDKGSVDIKAFINGTLIPELDTALADKLSNTTMTEAIELAIKHIGIERTKTDIFFDGVLGNNIVQIIDFNNQLKLIDLQVIKIFLPVIS